VPSVETAAAQLERALGIAWRYLNRRDRTVAEMRQHLEKRGVEIEAAEQAIAELVEGSYLDDARFAQHFAEDRRTLDAWGSERIFRRLQELGIDRDLVEAAVGKRDAGEETGAALALLRTRHLGPMSDPRERQRALGLLVRRGYDIELAGDAIRAYRRDEQEAGA
jgi:regulatory protein